MVSPKFDNGYSLSSGLGFVRGLWSWSGSRLEDARSERCEVPLVHEKSVDVISLTLERTGCMMGRQDATTPRLGSALVKPWTIAAVVRIHSPTTDQMPSKAVV